MSEAPPSLPGVLSRPDAQIIIDALNRRIWELEESAVIVVGGDGVRLASGSATVSFPGSSKVSNEIEIPHGLGGVPEIQLTFQAGTVGSCFAELRSVTASVIKCRAVAPLGEPGAGSNGIIHWQAIG